MTLLTKSWMASGAAVSVLHVFDSACNLVDDQGQVASLVHANIGPGPFAIVLPLEIAFPQFLTEESPAAVAPDRITVGPLSIDTTDTPLWESRPNWQKVSAEAGVLFDYLQSISQPVQPMPLFGSGVLATSGSERAAAAIARLTSGLRSGDMDAIRRGAAGLAGLGSGLTPAGDDFLMGLIYASYCMLPHADAQSFASSIVAEAVPRTTTLSAAWLQAAGRGEATHIWHVLLDGLADRDEAAVFLALQQILATGHSSGGDALAGFETGLQYIDRRQLVESR